MHKAERSERKRAARKLKRYRRYDLRRKEMVEGRYGYHTYHQCTSKVYYPNERKANDAAAKVYGRYGTTVHPYKCAFCDGWHLSKKEPNEAIGDAGEVTVCCAADEGDRRRDTCPA